MAAVAPGATALVIRGKKGTGKTIIGVILKALIGPAHSFMASLRLRDFFFFALAFSATKFHKATKAPCLSRCGMA